MTGVLGRGKSLALSFNMGCIMELPTLRYESPDKYYGVRDNCELFDTNIDGWRIYERCRPDHLEMLGLLPEGVCCYSIVLETDVSTQEQLQARHQDVFKLTDDLDRVWTYVAGYPLKATDHRSEVGEGPERWHTNYKDVDMAIERAYSHSRFIIGGDWSIEPMRSIRLPTWPLKRALNILEQYRNAQVETHALIELHYQSLTARNTDSRLLFLAKALELGQSLLPGDDRPSKQKQLPDEVTRELDQSLSKLWKIANGRYETRHIVQSRQNPKSVRWNNFPGEQIFRWFRCLLKKLSASSYPSAAKPEPVELHPKLTPKERCSFIHDADLIIRGVVARQFGIEPLILKL